MPSTDDGALRTLLSESMQPSAVAEVLATLHQMQAIIQPDDGLKWFNDLYLDVTAAFAADMNSPDWQDPEWIQSLDVRFALLYLSALAQHLNDSSSAPKCWAPMFEARSRAGLARIQLALAGMNAHINHDLPIAVVGTCEECGVAPASGSPQHCDYLRINTILASVMDAASAELMAGVPGTVLENMKPVQDVVGIWSVDRARDAAWDTAELLWNMRSLGMVENGFLAGLDRMTGLAGRGLLISVV